MAKPRSIRPTTFSRPHYHELSADETEARERGFESRGAPIDGPSLREAEQEAEPAPPPPAAARAEPPRRERPGPPPRRRGARP